MTSTLHETIFISQMSELTVFLKEGDVTLVRLKAT